MILEIATIRIKLTFEYEYILNSEYITRIFDLYQSKGPVDVFDFELSFIEKNNLPSNNYTMEQRNDALYYENNDTFIFETDSWASTIYWNKKLMTTMFYNYENSDLLDRLFIRSVKLLTSLLILEKGGIPFHCSAVTDNNKFSILFSGQSSAGKTKMAFTLEFKKQWHIYNDEFNIILPCKDSCYVFSTPFTTPEKFIHCSHGSAPIKKIYFLKKSTSCKIETLSLPQKYFSVLGGIYTFPTSDKFSTLIMKSAEEIARNIPMEMLYINHEDTNPDTIIELIQ